MANEIVAGLKIVASAAGLSVFGSTQRSVLSLKSTTQQLSTQSNEFGRSLRNNVGSAGAQAVASLSTEYVRLGQNIDKAVKKQGELNAGPAAGSNTVTGQLETDRSHLQSEVMETLALGVSVALPVKLAIDFESAMADVKKVVDFKTDDGFQTLRSEILGLTRVLPQTSTELAKIATSGGQLGIASADIAQFTTTVAKMATAFDMSADAAGDSMAKLANIYQIPISKIGLLGDVINELSNSSAATAGDIVNTLSRIGGVTKAFGLTQEQAAALSNTFISLGKSPEVAATAINGMLIKLQTADKQGEKFTDALRSIHVSAKSLKTAIGKDAQGALSSFLSVVNQVPKADRMGLLVDLFGLEYADDVAVLAGSMDTYGASLKLVGDASNFAGSMEKEFQARSATTANNLKLLNNGMGEIGINIGTVVLPPLNELINTLRPIVSDFANWARVNGEVVSNTIKVVTGILALKIGVIGMTYAVTVGASALNGLGFALSVATRQTALFNTAAITTRLAPFIAGVKALGAAIPGLSSGFALLSGVIAATPIGWLLGGIAAVALAGTLIYKYWEPIKAWTGAFLTGLKIGLEPVSQAFSAAFESAGPLLTFLGNAIRPIAQWFMDLIKPLDMSGDALGRVGGAGMEFGRVVGGFITTLSTPLRWALKTISELPKAFEGGIGGIMTVLGGFAPINLIYQAFSSVGTFLGIEMPAKFADFGKMMVDGLVNGISNSLSSAKDAVVGMGASIKGWFTETLGIQSPSRVFMGYGENVSEGAAIGIAAQTGLIRKAALGMVAATGISLGAPQMAAAAPSMLASQAQAFAASTQPQALAMGSAPTTGAPGGAGITIHLTQQFTITGGSGNVQEQVMKAGRMSFEEFRTMLDQVERDRTRRSYGPART